MNERDDLPRLREAARTMVDSAESQAWYDEEGIIKYIVDETDWHDFLAVLTEIEHRTDHERSTAMTAQPIGCYHNHVLVTDENIEAIREDIPYGDQADAIEPGMTISTYGFLYAGGSRGQTTVYHDTDRAALGLGGDSIWGDYSEETQTITTDDQDDDGNWIRYDVFGDRVEDAS